MNKWFPKYSDIILYSKLSVGNMYTHTHTHTHTHTFNCCICLVPMVRTTYADVNKWWSSTSLMIISATHGDEPHTRSSIKAKYWSYNICKTIKSGACRFFCHLHNETFLERFSFKCTILCCTATSLFQENRLLFNLSVAYSFRRFITATWMITTAQHTNNNNGMIDIRQMNEYYL